MLVVAGHVHALVEHTLPTGSSATCSWTRTTRGPPPRISPSAPRRSASSITTSPSTPSSNRPRPPAHLLSPQPAYPSHVQLRSSVLPRPSHDLAQPRHQQSLSTPSCSRASALVAASAAVEHHMPGAASVDATAPEHHTSGATSADGTACRGHHACRCRTPILGVGRAKRDTT